MPPLILNWGEFVKINKKIVCPQTENFTLAARVPLKALSFHCRPNQPIKQPYQILQEKVSEKRKSSFRRNLKFQKRDWLDKRLVDPTFQRSGPTISVQITTIQPAS